MPRPPATEHYELTDAEKRDLIALIQAGKPLPDRFRFLLFADRREVELVWNGKTRDVCTAILPFQTLEHIDEPRKEAGPGSARVPRAASGVPPEAPVELQPELFDTGGRQIKGWTNKLIWGDNKLILSSLKSGALRRQIDEADSANSISLNYLIQHSAGSGKTNSISWLSHRLASLHDAKNVKVFDCVVVITDRQVLDRQLQDAIYQIEHAQGVVKAIDQDSKQLAAALIDGTKIVITTLQKFPFVLRGLLHAAGAETQEEATAEQKADAATWEAEIARRRYAVIVDEAHSSQSGETARELKAILGAAAKAENPEEEPDWEDRLNQVMQSRGRQPNLSFFAFTATPKGKTLELFGRKGASGLPEAFHLYSMRQAIEEGFILDVVKNYTTYTTYYRLVKAVEDDPNLPKKKAARALAKFMSLHPHNIEQKTEVMVEHFRQKVRGHLGGQAKAIFGNDTMTLVPVTVG